MDGPPFSGEQAVGLVVDTRQPRVVAPFVPPVSGGTGPSAVSISPDGSLVAIGHADGSFEIARVGGGAPALRRVAGDTRVTAFGWSARHGQVAVADASGAIAVYSTHDPDQVQRFASGGTQVDAVALPSDGHRVLSLDQSGTITSRSLLGASAIAGVVATGRTSALAPGPPGTFVAVGGDDGRVALYDQRTLNPIRQFWLGPYAGPDATLEPAYHRRVSALAVTPDGSEVVAGDRVGHLRVWSSAGGRPLWSRDDAPTSFLAVSPNGHLLATAGYRPVEAPSQAHHPDGEALSTSITVYDIETHAVVFADPFADEIGSVSTPKPRAIAFSPDSSLLAAQFSGRTALYDVATGHLAPIPEQVVGGPGMAFSADGVELLSIGDSGTVTSFEPHHRRVMETFVLPTGAGRLAPSADGRWLFASSAAGLSVWDGSSHRLVLSRLPVPADGTGDALSLATTTDGHLFVGTQTSLVRFDLDPSNWSVPACRFAGRPLSQDEWSRYLPGRPYAPACPVSTVNAGLSNGPTSP